MHAFVRTCVFVSRENTLTYPHAIVPIIKCGCKQLTDRGDVLKITIYYVPLQGKGHIVEQGRTALVVERGQVGRHWANRTSQQRSDKSSNHLGTQPSRGQLRQHYLHTKYTREAFGDIKRSKKYF